MTRSYVQKITTSIKIGAVETEIGRLTLFTGANKTGKSTRVNAIEAAGSGRVSDVAGRATLAKDADLITLAPNNGNKVFAKVTLSDKTVAEWVLERGHRAKRTGPEIAFPIRDVREAILGEPDKARKWILRHGGALAWDEVKKLVPKSLHKRLASIVSDEDAGAAGGDGSNLLPLAIDNAKRLVRESSAALRAAREGAKPAQPPPTDEEMAEAERIVAGLGLVEQVMQAKQRIATIETEISALRVQQAKGVEEENAVRAEITALGQVPVIADLAKSALLVAEALAQAKANNCAICGAVIDHAAFAKRAETARRKLDAGMKANAEGQRLAQKLAAVQGPLSRITHTISVLEGEKSRLEKIAASVEIVSDPAAARAKLSALHSLRAAWDLVTQNEETALEVEREAVEWSQLADALSITLGKLVERARLGFEAKVQAFLPASWQFGVDLVDGEREVLRIGLRDQTVLRCALSGAEWATVTAALGLATAPADGPVVIAPEERAFDANTLADVLEAFAKVGDAAQVILTSPIGPSRTIPGWTVIETKKLPPIGTSQTVVPVRDPNAPRPGPGRGKKGQPQGEPKATEAAVMEAAGEEPKPVKTGEMFVPVKDEEGNTKLVPENGAADPDAPPPVLDLFGP
jgi:hypothetical protein